MRIALLSHAYVPHPGGVEIVVQNLARELSSGHEVIVVSTSWQELRGVSQEGPVAIHRLPALHLTERFGVPYPVPYGPGVREAMRAVATCDVIHAHGALYPGSMAAAALSAARSIPFLLTEHVGFVDYGKVALNAAQRLAWSTVGDAVVRRAGALTTVGERVAAWMRDRYPERAIQVVANGVDCARFRPLDARAREEAREGLALPAGRTLALFVGRHTPKKNLPAVLGIPRTNFDLVLCGERSAVQGERLMDLGFIPHEQMPKLYGCADLLVHAATGEGFPLAVQEALACGLPVVLLWDPGYRTLIDREVVRACDSLEQLGREAIALASDPAARAALSARGRAFAQRSWNWTATAATYLDLYRNAATGALSSAESPRACSRS
jgi:D-inositol-3-phosphate glycosyltransferase